MDVIDETKPVFMYSLHNAGFGGAYWYITREAKEVYDGFYNAAKSRNVPLNLGEPEAPFIPEFSPAIYQMLSMQQEYDYAEKYGDGHPEKSMTCGDSSDSYAKKYGTFCLVAELPYFYSPKIEDQTELDYPRLDAVLKGLDEQLEVQNKMASYFAQYRDLCGDDNVFVKIHRQMIDQRIESHNTAVNFAKQNKDNEKPCKVSEEFDNLVITKFYLMLGWGSLIRGAKYERDKRKGTKEEELLNKIIPEMEEELVKLSKYVEEKTQYSVVPIQRLVGVQLESGMLCAEYIQKHK